MNASRLANPLPRGREMNATYPSQFWIVADLSELQHGFVCETLEDVHTAIDTIHGKNGQPFRVLRVGEGELGRDVTSDFLPDEEDPVFGASKTDFAHQLRMEGAA